MGGRSGRSTTEHPLLGCIKRVQELEVNRQVGRFKFNKTERWPAPVQTIMSVKRSIASCWSCGSSSHMKHDCPRKSRGFNQDDRHRWGSQPSAGRRGGQRQGACFKCGLSGHWASNCRSTSHNSGQAANQQGPLPSWAVPSTRNNPTPHLQFQFPPPQFVAPTNMAQQPSIAVQQQPVLHQQLHPGPPSAPPPPPPGNPGPVMASQ